MRLSFSILLLLLIVSCKSYTISTESFKEQMVNATEANLKNSETNNPLLGGIIEYKSNDIDRLIVRDKDGGQLYLKNTPAIEMRVTHNNGKRFHFYFDTVTLENNILKGARSRFMPNMIREIPMDSIIKIEVQDGGKNFN